MSVGDNIRERRQKLNLSQAYVADQVGVSQAMLCCIERGTKNPSLQVSVAIAAVLKCSVEDLMR